MTSIEALSIPEAEHQLTEERSFRSTEYQELFQIPRDSSFMLYNPGAVRADSYDNAYVLDFGTLNIHRFDRNGSFVATYGMGQGDGPGELTTILDYGSMGDSAVYVVDNLARRISLYDWQGGLLNSFTTQFDPVRFAVTQSGREYIMTSHLDYLFESRLEGEITAEFGGIPDNPHGHGSSMALGVIAPYGEKLIYVPALFAAIVQYNSDGSIVYARTTPDWSTTDVPGFEPLSIDGMSGYRVSGELLHRDISLVGDSLYVHRVLEDDDLSGVMDVYAAPTGQYAYSFRLPTNGFSYVMNDRLYQVNDSTSRVSVYEIIHQ